MVKVSTRAKVRRYFDDENDCFCYVYFFLFFLNSLLLSLSNTPQVDATDALAVALCHTHTNQYNFKISPNGVILKNGNEFNF
jgi:hypothetical protein